MVSTDWNHTSRPTHGVVRSVVDLEELEDGPAPFRAYAVEQAGHAESDGTALVRGGRRADDRPPQTQPLQLRAEHGQRGEGVDLDEGRQAVQVDAEAGDRASGGRGAEERKEERRRAVQGVQAADEAAGEGVVLPGVLEVRGGRRRGGRRPHLSNIGLAREEVEDVLRGQRQVCDEPVQRERGLPQDPAVRLWRWHAEHGQVFEACELRERGGHELQAQVRRTHILKRQR